MNIYSEDKMYENYSSEIEKMQKCIDELQQENQELKKQYCESTDCGGRIGNSKKVEELQKENKQLKIQISAREEVCNRLENNWNKLKEIAKSQSGFKKRADLKGGLWFEVDDLLDKMHELEQGSDSNE